MKDCLRIVCVAKGFNIDQTRPARDGRWIEQKSLIRTSHQQKYIMNKLYLGIIAIGCAAAMSASADILVDRGLPTANLNNAAGSDRANVAWAFSQYTSSDYYVVGDTFANTTSQGWAISDIRVWTVGQTDTAVLRGGYEGSDIGIASSTYTVTGATYVDGSTYQGTSGSSIAMHQINFAVNILLAPGQVYDFFLDGSGSGDGTYVPFVHASNAALSGSPQDGADNTMLYAEVVNGSIALGNVGTWSSLGNGWDKASDVNVQVFGSPVPEPTTIIAGVLTLVPFGGSALRLLRNWR
jgi:hypothetical protein